jgi:hypothetical protein
MENVLLNHIIFHFKRVSKKWWCKFVLSMGFFSCISLFLILILLTNRFVVEANTSMFEGKDLEDLKIIFEHSDVDVIELVLHKQPGLFQPLKSDQKISKFINSVCILIFFFFSFFF